MAGLDHPNVVPLLGSCCEADHRVAVFDYMPHGNLRDLLDSKTPTARHFNWPARLNVLLGVAKGLEYLHHVSCHLTLYHMQLPISPEISADCLQLVGSVPSVDRVISAHALLHTHNRWFGFQ